MNIRKCDIVSGVSHELIPLLQWAGNEARTRDPQLGNFNQYYLREVVSSKDAIDRYIHGRQLSENSELGKLHKAGIQVEATLPEHLQHLSYALKAIHNYPGGRSADKFFRLVVKGKKFAVDTHNLELFFETQGIKVYVDSDRLKEYRELETICRYFMEHEIPAGDIKQSNWLNKRFEHYGRNLIRPRHQYFCNTWKGKRCGAFSEPHLIRQAFLAGFLMSYIGKIAKLV